LAWERKGCEPKKASVRVSFIVRVRVRVSDSLSASVSFVVNIMFEIAGCEVSLSLPTYTIMTTIHFASSTTHAKCNYLQTNVKESRNLTI